MRNVLGTRHGLSAFRTLTIVAQDPSVRTADGKVLLAKVSIPAEQLLPGPAGYRVSVVDYDATRNALYTPLDLGPGLEEPSDAIAAVRSDRALMSDPRYHAQNVYAIVMRILARFELALGRRVPWGCAGHQLYISPHAFCEPNAFYSREDCSLFFGYFTSSQPSGETVYSCLAHDVVAHETTHALLDGLRRGFLDRSSLDQAAFHEGFSDIVALLSVLSLTEIVSTVLDGRPEDPLIRADLLTKEKLKESTLFGLANQMGEELSGVRGQALRRSVELPPGKRYADKKEFQEEHRRGELLVAAVLNSFLEIWLRRLEKIGTISAGKKDRGLVVEEGARAADHLLTIVIRAIDYCPPVDLSFSDFLSALLTIDREVVPDDRYGYREALLKSFRDYGVEPAPDADTDGTWKRWEREMIYSRTHFESMLRDEEEMFRFIWENRTNLDLSEHGHIEVRSVRPSMRIAPDGFILRETVAEYVHSVTASAEELRDDFGIAVPEGLPLWRNIKLAGGGTLIFDEYGQLKYKVAKGLVESEADKTRQGAKLKQLFELGFFDGPVGDLPLLAQLHSRIGQLRRLKS